jgi:hypothetical protein
MYETVKGEYGDSAVWIEKPEPPRVDRKLDQIPLKTLLRERKWDVATLDWAIAAMRFPGPIGRQLKALDLAQAKRSIRSHRSRGGKRN